MTVSLNLVPKRGFCIKLRFASFYVKTLLRITVSLKPVPCVFPHFLLNLGYAYNVPRHTCAGVVGIAGVVNGVHVVGV